MKKNVKLKNKKKSAKKEKQNKNRKYMGCGLICFLFDWTIKSI